MLDRRKVLHEWIDRMPKENLWAFFALMRKLESSFFGYFTFKCKSGVVYECEAKHLMREGDQAENVCNDK